MGPDSYEYQHPRLTRGQAAYVTATCHVSTAAPGGGRRAAHLKGSPAHVSSILPKKGSPSALMMLYLQLSRLVQLSRHGGVARLACPTTPQPCFPWRSSAFGHVSRDGTNYTGILACERTTPTLLKKIVTQESRRRQQAWCFFFCLCASRRGVARAWQRSAGRETVATLAAHRLARRDGGRRSFPWFGNGSHSARHGHAMHRPR